MGYLMKRPPKESIIFETCNILNLIILTIKVYKNIILGVIYHPKDILEGVSESGQNDMMRLGVG